MNLKTILPSEVKNYNWIPSVTGLLWLIEDPNFDMIKKNHPEILKQACDRGSSIHAYIEDFYLKKNPILDLKYIEFIQQFLVFQAQNKFEWWMKFEQTLMCEDFWWTIDCINEVSEWNFTIIDWKTWASELNNMMLFKYSLQLTAYRILLEHNWYEWSFKWKIVLFTKWKYKIYEVDVYEKESDFMEILNHYKNLCNTK